VHFLVTDKFPSIVEGFAAVAREAAILVSMNFVQQKGGASGVGHVVFHICFLALKI